MSTETIIFFTIKKEKVMVNQWVLQFLEVPEVTAEKVTIQKGPNTILLDVSTLATLMTADADCTQTIYCDVARTLVKHGTDLSDAIAVKVAIEATEFMLPNN